MNHVVAVSSNSGLLGAARSFDLLIRNVDRDLWLPIAVCPSPGPLVDQLREGGIVVTIIPKDPDINEFSLEGTAFKLSLRLLVRLPSRLKYAWELWRLIRQEQDTLVYLNTIKNAMAALSAKLADRPVVWHVREVDVDFTGIRKLRLHVLKALADKVIVVSNHNRQQLINLGVLPEKIVTIYNGVDVDYFTPPVQRESLLASQLGIEMHEIVIGMIGEWSQRKGVVQFLKAAAELVRQYPDLKFILVGGSSVSERDHAYLIHHLINELGLRSRVCAVGAQRDVRPYLGLIDILVMPSLAEAFTRVNLEGMAMGKPIVATDVGGTREGVLDGETGFIIPPNDPLSIAKKVQILLEHRELIRQMGQKGRERAVTMFNVKRYVREVQLVWKSALVSSSIPS